MMDEDWAVLVSLFPPDWRELAAETGALKGLRKDKSCEDLLRTLLIHLGCGYSLRETVVRARQAGLAELSDVALFKRLKKCRPWLQALCQAAFSEHGLTPPAGERALRLFDATHISEPGKTGGLWRVHYSLEAPALRCDYLKLTPVGGAGTGESFRQYPVFAGDYILADRGYCTASGIDYADAQGGFLTVRFKPQNVALTGPQGEPFDLLARIKRLRRTGEVRTWPVCVDAPSRLIPGRVCAVRKSREAIRQAQKRTLRRASRRGHEVRPQTLVYDEYAIVFTTFPEAEFPPDAVMEWYRVRWQIELVFKRFKQIAQLGHLPKQDDESAQAWLYGKLFIALMTEKLIQRAKSFSPWGYPLNERTSQPLA